MKRKSVYVLLLLLCLQTMMAQRMCITDVFSNTDTLSNINRSRGNILKFVESYCDLYREKNIDSLTIINN